VLDPPSLLAALAAALRTRGILVVARA
jgi:hypothetical protein